MLAVMHVALPFELVVPEGEQFNVYSYERDGYEIEVGVPSKSDIPLQTDGADEVKVGDLPAFAAGALTLTFRKPTFSRDPKLPHDPPDSLVSDALASVIDHLKYVTKGSSLRDVDFPNCNWKMSYLNDDGSELEKEEGLVRGLGGRKFQFSYVACDSKIWDSVFSLPQDFRAPAWHTLLIDSRGALPHVGTAIVLVATALEVFIAEILNNLSANAEKISPMLWKWINDRGNYLRDPSVAEQFDVLLKELCGHSLKEERELWDAMQNIRSVRNSFAHEGRANFGGKLVTHQDAVSWLDKADAIVAKIREWLPNELRWPVFSHVVTVQITKTLLRAPPSGSAPPAV